MKANMAMMLVEESNKKTDQPEIWQIDPEKETAKENPANISLILNPLRRLERAFGTLKRLIRSFNLKNPMVKGGNLIHSRGLNTTKVVLIHLQSQI